jgi:hypothetical protein
VKVVGHKAVSVQTPSPSLKDMGAEHEEPPAIVVVVKDRLAAVSSRGDVVDTAGDLDTGRSGH